MPRPEAMTMDSITTPLIQISGLTKQYYTRTGDITVALDHIHLDVVEGEFIALVGPSGCGKTTLLKILAGLEGRFEGEARLGDVAIIRPSSEVGVVFQEPTLLPWRTILDNVLLPVELKHLDRKIYTQRARELMEMIGLKGFENKYPRELSGGMRQRAGICRALVRDPKVLLMDEPFGALDAMTREFLNAELQRIWLKSGKTIIFVTHSIPEAVFLADRIVLLGSHPGRMISISQVPFERPRKLSLLHDPAFTTMVSELRTAIAGAGGRNPMSEVDND